MVAMTVKAGVSKFIEISNSNDMHAVIAALLKMKAGDRLKVVGPKGSFVMLVVE